MQELNLPAYSAKVRQANGTTQIFDTIRKKWLKLTPEEWVRQHFIHYLIEERSVPASLIAIEMGLKYNRLQKRGDIIIYKEGEPWMIVECKAPSIVISQDTFDQVARYNTALNVQHVVVTNGLQHFCCEMDYENNAYQFLEEVPEFKA